MLQRLWRWLKRYFQRLFGNQQTLPLREQRQVETPQRLTDAEYESLFFELLAEVERGSTKGEVKAFLDGKRINKAHLVEWLRGFGEGLVGSPNDELAKRMVRLGELGIGEVSDVAYDIVRRLRIRERNCRGKEGTEGEGDAKAMALLRQAYQKLQSGEFESAFSSVNLAVALKINDKELASGIWQLRGIVLVNLRRFEEAIASFDSALDIKRDDHETWYNRGVALANLRRFEEAITSYDSALNIKRNYDAAWCNQGVALVNLGRFKEAIVSYDKAIEFKPDRDEAWNGRGAVLSNLGQYEEALASYNSALNIKRDDHKTWYNKGLTLNRLEQFEEAMASYNNALKFKPDDHETWYSRGVTLHNLRQLFEEAIASYDNALKFKPDYHQAWVNRGIAAGNLTGERTNTLPDPAAPNLALKFNNSDLNKRGYDGQLASYKEGLKHCQQGTHPEGSGKLHQAIGNAHYFRGQGNSNPRYFWDKAVNSYKTALQTLTATDFPEFHLEVLQNLIRVQLDLGETAEATELQRQGTDLLRRLLDEPNRSDRSKKQLALKFAWLQQLTVDLAVQSEDLLQAIELAEQGKNTCLRWILDKWNDENSSVSYSQIQQLLNPSTAIIYWHLSSYALHTFIVKHNAPSPIVLGETEFVTHAQRLQDFEAWLKNWNQQYADYRDKAKDEQSRKSYPWRLLMPEKLEELKNILNISAIEQELNNITNLILIPHRDLHRLPLHAIFTDNFTITYLPSAQIGINLKSLRETNVTAIHQLPLLSVEHPKREDFPMLPHAEIESAAITQLFQNPTPKRIAEEVATNTTVKAALKDSYNIFHFTGHSTYNFHNPQESALALSGKEFLTLGEICNIENMKIYQLVSLSSCETAITSNQTITAEYVGLVSAFLYQGVTNVVSTLWTVTDDASSFLMIYFYWQIKKGKSPAVALDKARKWLRNLTFSKLERIYRVIFVKLPSDEMPLRPFIRSKLYQLSQMELLEKKEQHFQHPYYWAGFIITGGYRL
ncbi:MAG: CHAT domain-containing protein [Nostoc sp. DcaGUA01]|nr:CHAT domain-containing protein [Nostoc sp. DcaGUA01]